MNIITKNLCILLVTAGISMSTIGNAQFLPNPPELSPEPTCNISGPNAIGIVGFSSGPNAHPDITFFEVQDPCGNTISEWSLPYRPSHLTNYPFL